MKPWLLVLIMVLSCTLYLRAQRIRGAEIYKHITQFNVTAYAYVYREGGTKPVIAFDWGDNSIDSFPLGYYTQLHPSGYWLDTYAFYHTYAGPGWYEIGFTDSFLVAKVANIENSGMKLITMRDSLRLWPYEHLFSHNEGPEFFTSQFNIQFYEGIIHHDFFYVYNEPYEDDHRAELAPFPADGFSYPASPAEMYLQDNNVVLIWDHPSEPGTYAIGIKVREMRPDNTNPSDSVLMGTTLRAMMIDVTPEMIVSTTKPGIGGVLGVYPNPASEWLYVQIGGFQMPVQVRIFDDRGRQVYEGQRAASNVMEEWCIWVRDWPPGLYLVQIETGGHMVTRKIIVQQ